MNVKIATSNFVIALLSICILSCADKSSSRSERKTDQEFDQSHYFGKANPLAPPEVKDFDQLIGNCDCKSLQYVNGEPGDTLTLKWKWKYILNGYGVQDEGWYGNDSIQNYFTSIRILNSETKQWHVPFFTPNMTTNPQIWIGGKQEENIVLRRTQTTQNGEFESILTFSNISEKGFNWEGKIFLPDTNTTNIFWRIWCLKEQ